MIMQDFKEQIKGSAVYDTWIIVVLILLIGYLCLMSILEELDKGKPVETVQIESTCIETHYGLNPETTMVFCGKIVKE